MCENRAILFRARFSCRGCSVTGQIAACGKGGGHRRLRRIPSQVSAGTAAPVCRRRRATGRSPWRLCAREEERAAAAARRLARPTFSGRPRLGPPCDSSGGQRRPWSGVRDHGGQPVYGIDPEGAAERLAQAGERGDPRRDMSGLTTPKGTIHRRRTASDEAARPTMAAASGAVALAAYARRVDLLDDGPRLLTKRRWWGHARDGPLRRAAFGNFGSGCSISPLACAHALPYPRPQLLRFPAPTRRLP